MSYITSYIIILSDIAFGLISLFLGYQFFKMLNSRDEFKCGIPQFLLIAMPVLAGIFFLTYPFILDSSSQIFYIFRSFRFPIMSINAVLWLYFMTPKVSVLPKESELEIINSALKTEIKNRTLTEEKLLNLNAHLDKTILQKTKELQTIIDSSPLAIVKLDRQFKVSLWNKAAQNLFGWEEHEVLGKFIPIIPEREARAVQESLKKTILENKIIQDEVNRLHKNGSMVNVRIWNAPLAYETSEDAMLTMFDDNTERKKMMEELESAKQNALAANQSKSDFLARISHEIRTPLNAIIGFSEILSSEKIDDEERKIYLATVNKNGQFLSRLINDLLDFSKIEAGKIKFESKNINLQETFDDIIETARVNIVNKPVGIYLQPLAPAVPKYIRTDPLRFRQILLNLLSNSVKFTNEGTVSLFVDFTPSKEKQDEGLLVIKIKDTGIGMTETQSQLLFKPYYQAELNISRKYGGTGLGLSIAKHLAKLMGGDITLENTQPGKGSEFSIAIATTRISAIDPELKLAEAKDGTLKNSNEAQSLDGKNILIVDDSKDNLFLVSRILTKAGGHIDTAQDGAEGVQRCLQHKYDVVLMDLEMPKMDGVEALHKLRSLGVHTHVIALTGHAYEDDRIKCLEAGFDDHISKPVDKKTLIASVLKNSDFKTTNHVFDQMN